MIRAGSQKIRLHKLAKRNAIVGNRLLKGLFASVGRGRLVCKMNASNEKKNALQIYIKFGGNQGLRAMCLHEYHKDAAK